MKYAYLSLITLLLSGCLSTPLPQNNAVIPKNDICSVIDGATILAPDGQYLGKLTHKNDPDSVLNDDGSYGGNYSTTSIWNEYGSYGGEYSSNSPFNEFASPPPSLVKNGRMIRYLSVNKNVTNSLNPNAIKSCQFY